MGEAGDTVVHNSTELIAKAQERYEELSHKGWEWRSFYSGFLEGFSVHQEEDRAKESSPDRQNPSKVAHGRLGVMPAADSHPEERNAGPSQGDLSGLSKEDLQALADKLMATFEDGRYTGGFDVWRSLAQVAVEHVQVKAFQDKILLDWQQWQAIGSRFKDGDKIHGLAERFHVTSPIDGRISSTAVEVLMRLCQSCRQGSDSGDWGAWGPEDWPELLEAEKVLGTLVSGPIPIQLDLSRLRRYWHHTWAMVEVKSPPNPQTDYVRWSDLLILQPHPVPMDALKAILECHGPGTIQPDWAYDKLCDWRAEIKGGSGRHGGN